MKKQMKRKFLSGIKKKFKKILMKKSIQLLFIAFTIVIFSCESKVKTDSNQKNLEVSDQPKNKALGNLFIIGGGKKSDALVAELIDLSKLKAEKYMVILPMASEEPDSPESFVPGSPPGRRAGRSLPGGF